MFYEIGAIYLLYKFNSEIIIFIILIQKEASISNDIGSIEKISSQNNKHKKTRKTIFQ